ncbi:hypothetical protein F4801DRAFT_582805 [Xylaria longipes]|nr:hypothetical protein F4801DRAFT_582805 [Xylaria longipes]
MRFSLHVFALYAVGASTAAFAPREWSVPSSLISTQTFDIDGKGDPATGRPDILFAGGQAARVNEPEGELTVTQIFWDETNEYRASGSVPFTGEAGEYKITINNLTSAPK